MYCQSVWWKILVQAYIGYGGIWRDMEGMVIIVYMPQMKRGMFWCLCEHPRPLPVLGAIPYIIKDRSTLMDGFMN